MKRKEKKQTNKHSTLGVSLLQTEVLTLVSLFFPNSYKISSLWVESLCSEAPGFNRRQLPYKESSRTLQELHLCLFLSC